jgi:hypothetical protein
MIREVHGKFGGKMRVACYIPDSVRRSNTPSPPPSPSPLPLPCDSMWIAYEWMETRGQLFDALCT